MSKSTVGHFHRDGIGNHIADGAPACLFIVEHHVPGRENT